jgi:Peptidase M15
MCTPIYASAGIRSTDHQSRLRSLVLIPAMVITAAAIQAPATATAAVALSGDLRWHGARPGPEAVRYTVTEEVEVRPRAAGRRHAYARRRAHHRHEWVVSKSRHQATAVRASRQRTRAVSVQLPPDIEAPRPDPVPLPERSVVAMHPLARDSMSTPTHHPIASGDVVPGAEGAPPRCTGEHPNTFAFAMASIGRDVRTSEPAMVGGEWPHCRGATYSQSNWRLASLGTALQAPTPPTAHVEPGWPINWRASASCLAAPLRAVLDLVAGEFGPLTVNSTCRSRVHNARVGGAPRSYHLTGNAVDFRVPSRFDQVLGFLKRLHTVGGLTHYGSGVFHIDTGPRRTWAPNSWGANRVRTARRRG